MAILSLISVKKTQKPTLKKRILGQTKPKAVLDCYKDYFGTINIYNLFYYKNKEKALASLLKVCEEKTYMNNSPIPLEYLQALSCKQLLANNSNLTKYSLSLYFVPEKKLLIELCRKLLKVYIIGKQPPSYLDEIWKECGTVPIMCSFSIKTDFVLLGNETPVLKELDAPFKEICPKDFSPTLFAGLLYKENGIFLS